MSAATTPDPKGNDGTPLAAYRKALFDWNQRLCAWLGLDPELLLEVGKSDPGDDDTVTITWRAISAVTPKQGIVTQRHARPCDARDLQAAGLMHTGTVLLLADEAAALERAVGPKPDLLTAADRARLTQLFSGRS